MTYVKGQYDTPPANLGGGGLPAHFLTSTPHFNRVAGADPANSGSLEEGPLTDTPNPADRVKSRLPDRDMNDMERQYLNASAVSNFS